MAAEAKPKGNPKFPLRLMPSVRKTAEAFSEKEGVSLNQFINLAVAEKLAHLEHDEWAQGRKKPTQSLVDGALRVLEKSSGRSIQSGDELPEGYKPARLGDSKRKHA